MALLSQRDRLCYWQESHFLQPTLPDPLHGFPPVHLLCGLPPRQVFGGTGAVLYEQVPPSASEVTPQSC